MPTPKKRAPQKPGIKQLRVLSTQQLLDKAVALLDDVTNLQTVIYGLDDRGGKNRPRRQGRSRRTAP